MRSRATALALLIIVWPLTGSAGELADAARGAALYESRCSACHSIDVNRVGPMHRGVYGRRAGSVEDYAYSEALKKSRVLWTETTLELWLADPEAFVPGQKMGFRVASMQDRFDIIAYLKRQSSQLNLCH